MLLDLWGVLRPVPQSDVGTGTVQVTFPPPYGGYDHNWALFGLGTDAAAKTFNGVVSEE